MDHSKGPSVNGRPFYRIVKNDEGTVDVWLTPGKPVPIWTEDGICDYNFQILAVRGVVPFPGMEEDIRRRYQDWCDSAEVIEI